MDHLAKLTEMVGESTYSNALEAARALLRGASPKVAAQKAGIDERTLRKYRAADWWPLMQLAAEEEFRSEALGEALVKLRETMQGEDPAQAYDAAKFITRMFLVELPKLSAKVATGGMGGTNNHNSSPMSAHEALAELQRREGGQK